MDEQTEQELLSRFREMFACDAARIYHAMSGKLFLIIGWKRNTRDDAGQWTHNGVPVDFDYLREKVIASGDTPDELIASAEKYKRLQGMTWKDYFAGVMSEAL